MREGLSFVVLFAHPDLRRATARLRGRSHSGVIGLFNPIRSRVQRWVDRRFNRSVYDASILAGEFSSEMRDP